MDLAIAHNPYSQNPEELYEAIRMESGDSYIDQVEPDREGLKGLQALISPNMDK